MVPRKDLNSLVLKIILHKIRCMLRVVILLEYKIISIEASSRGLRVVNKNLTVLLFSHNSLDTVKKTKAKWRCWRANSMRLRRFTCLTNGFFCILLCCTHEDVVMCMEILAYQCVLLVTLPEITCVWAVFQRTARTYSFPN